MKNPKELLKTPEYLCDDFIFDFIGGMMAGYRRMHVFNEAVNLGLFDVTCIRSSADHISEALSLNPILVGMLCDCLVEMGLLKKIENEYENTVISKDYLVKSSNYYQGDNVGMVLSKFKEWNELDKIMKNGPHIIDREKLFGTSWIKGIAQGAMGGGIASVLKHIETHIDMSSVTSMLDLGGGHGLYTIAFCFKYSNIKGTVFDMKGITDVTREYIDEYGSNVNVITGDYYKDEIGGPYGLIFTSFNNACSDPSLAPKIACAVNPGGYLIIRRHRIQVSMDPFSNLEWNLIVSDPSMIGKSKHASHLSKSEEYNRILEENGFTLISDEIYDSKSSLIIYKKEL